MYKYNENVRDLTDSYYLDRDIKKALDSTKAVETIYEAIYMDMPIGTDCEVTFGYVKLKSGTIGFTLDSIAADNGLQTGGYMIVRVYKLDASKEISVTHCCVDMKEDIPQQIEKIINTTCEFFSDTGKPRPYSGHRGVCM